MELRIKSYLLVVFVLLSAALYVPWLGNPLVFDDIGLLGTPALFDYALSPFAGGARGFPYFTLGFESVVFNGDIRLSRVVTLLLHAFNGFLLFCLSQSLLQKFLTPRRAFITALLMAVFFVAHPVGVYGVAYLIQRTIILATLFLLLSALLFQQALSHHSIPRAVLAGLSFGMAVLSKEHALTGLIGVLGLALMHQGHAEKRRFVIPATYLATALPFAVWVGFLKLVYVGAAYEPDALNLMSASQFPDTGGPLGTWLFSASSQGLFFFRYWGAWVWPAPAALSIDIRPDFNFLFASSGAYAGLPALLTLSMGMAFLLCSRTTAPALKLAAYGMLWALSLFVIELASIRFQEPIVLYRSYLWGPAFLLALAGFMSALPGRVALISATVAVLVCLPITWGRLHTFSDELSLWQDAALKLPHTTVSGATRIRYNLGIFHNRAGDRDRALEEFEWVIQREPNHFAGYWGRSTVRAGRNELALAAEDLATVIRLKPQFGLAHYQYGTVLKALGRLRESEGALATAKTLGVPSIELK
jgi:tetratricopeptide (TPR) repeat protein